MIIFLLNLVGLIFPALIIVIMSGNNSVKTLILSASGLFVSWCMKNYGFANELQLDYFGAIMIAFLSVFFTSQSTNKVLYKKTILAYYPVQTTRKVLPIKYHLCEWFFTYFLFLAVFAGGAVMFIYTLGIANSFENNVHQIVENPQSQISQFSIISEVNNHIAMIYLVLAMISGVLAFLLRQIKKNMLPKFWRLQLLPLFNPEHKNIESIEEITDKEYLKKIFEVNEVTLVDCSIEKNQSKWNEALDYIKQNYSLTIDEITQGTYIAGTTIGGLYKDDEYKLYFIQHQRNDDDKTPPAEIKKDEADSEKLNEGVTPNAI